MCQARKLRLEFCFVIQTFRLSIVEPASAMFLPIVPTVQSFISRSCIQLLRVVKCRQTLVISLQCWGRNIWLLHSICIHYAKALKQRNYNVLIIKWYKAVVITYTFSLGLKEYIVSLKVLEYIGGLKVLCIFMVAKGWVHFLFLCHLLLIGQHFTILAYIGTKQIKNKFTNLIWQSVCHASYFEWYKYCI